jgi:hypothetical protein
LLSLLLLPSFIRNLSSKIMSGLIVPPSLPIWLQQLAGILPLTALIEFIDLATKLHTFELSGAVSLWNWPITPAGARLLLSSRENIDACCLDHIENCTILHCIDGRYGDNYPSSTPTTTRLCVSTREVATRVENESPNMKAEGGRKQKLEVVLLTQLQPTVLSNLTAQLDSEQEPPFLRRYVRGLGDRSVRYRIVAAVGWACWMGATIVSFMAGLYVAGVYLLLMPLTGLLVRVTHGGTPRHLLDERLSDFMRMVVATSSMNGSDWWAFYGGSYTVNSLLNKPLYRVSVTPIPTVIKILLRVLIGGQWVLAVGSCALQDWNALVISIWLAFCVLVSTYAYPPESSVQDWLRYSCNILVERIQAEFSTRRSMLSAMIYLNPDSSERRTKWIDPILADAADRREWESAVLRYSADGVLFPFSLLLPLKLQTMTLHLKQGSNGPARVLGDGIVSMCYPADVTLNFLPLPSDSNPLHLLATSRKIICKICLNSYSPKV